MCARAEPAQPFASLNDVLLPIRDQTRVPALAAAVVLSNRIVAAGAVGVRVAESTARVTIDDKFHVGSCTKSMTATLIARLVEQGTFSWQTTVGESLRDLGGAVHRDYEAVKLEQLLSHTAGVPADLNKIGVWGRVWSRNGRPAVEQRLELTREILARRPESQPGRKFAYANAGYTIAGVMVERREGRAWEELMREKLFAPLGMTTAGFGVPEGAKSFDQPWGHALMDGHLVADPPGPAADNPAAIGPGGTVHCSVLDLARYVNCHLQGERGGVPWLKAESFKKLHAPMPGQGYALGWHVTKRPWAKGRTLMHNGTNTRNFAVMWLAPEIEFGLVVVCNFGGKTADMACDDTASRLIGQFLK